MPDAIVPDKKRKAGRPPFVPTDEQRRDVVAMCKFGIPQEDIALYLDIDVKTLTKNFRRELETEATRANMRVAQTLFKKAIKGDVAACIWWTKSRMHWKEDKAPAATTTVNVDNRSVTMMPERELLEQMQAEINRRLAK